MLPEYYEVWVWEGLTEEQVGRVLAEHIHRHEGW